MVAHPTLDEVIDLLGEIAPLELAADWDNVGLIVAPKSPKSVARVLLAIDLTEAVVKEARALSADLVVAYHPPIWNGLKQLDADDPVQRPALAAFAAGIAVYSPHTALDAAPGGIADWLCEGLVAGAAPKKLEACGDGDFGRVVELAKPVTVAALLPRIRSLLSVRTLRIAHTAKGGKHTVRRIGVAAGSGGAVLKGIDADLWLTGELSHHDALAAVAAGTCVVLGEHSNTERGYLKLLKKRLAEPFGRGLDVHVSRVDVDPFTIA
jgi:dinuclear metal center YbgI/SA1388 family protein